jgi:hypothetical protein
MYFDDLVWNWPVSGPVVNMVLKLWFLKGCQSGQFFPSKWITSIQESV